MERPFLRRETAFLFLHRKINLYIMNQRMPTLFIGHGSPMNAIEENRFVQGFRDMASEIPKPSKIICISAHWESRGSQVTAMEKPKTIHDFRGFQKELFEVQYPAPGNPNLAKSLHDLEASIAIDYSWGLDHGAWSVLKHLYPEANIPVVQLSLDVNKSPKEHFELGLRLKKYRDQGALIIGSGNIVHNLGQLSWPHLDKNFAFDWADEVQQKVDSWIKAGLSENIIDFRKQSSAFKLSIPTPEHYLPLLYVLASSSDSDRIKSYNDEIIAGSLSMTSYLFS